MVLLHLLAAGVLSTRGVLCPDPALLDEARQLSELPLDKLLHVKHAFSAPPASLAPGDEEVSTRSAQGPEAMALTGHRFGDWSARTAQDKKPGAISVFQGTVTTLAFLAFGGYILSLAVSAARAKTESSRALWAAAGGGGAWGGGRRRRDAAEDPGAERMLQALYTLAEGYAAYHDQPQL